jgi:hypothetical protein
MMSAGGTQKTDWGKPNAGMGLGARAITRLHQFTHPWMVGREGLG